MSAKYQSFLSPKTPKGDFIPRDLNDEFSPLGNYSNGNSFLNQSGNLLNGFQTPDAQFHPLPFSPSSGAFSPSIYGSPLSDRIHREKMNGNDTKNGSVSTENSRFLYRNYEGEKMERKMNGKENQISFREEENGMRMEDESHSRLNSLRDMEKIIDGQKLKIFDLKMQLYHWEERLKSHITNGTSFSDEKLQEILEKEVEYKVEIEKFSKLLMTSKDAIARLTLENENLKRKNASNTSVDDLRDQINRLEENREELLESLRRSEEENAELKRKMRESPSVSTGILAEVQRENNDFQIQIKALQDQLTRQENFSNRNVEKERESKKDWELKENEWKLQILEQRNKNEELAKLLDETHSLLDTMEYEKKRMESERNSFESKLNRNEEELERTRKREEKMREQVQYSLETAKNNQEVERLNLELREKEERNRNLLEHHEEIQSEYKKIQFELKQAQVRWTSQLDQKNQTISNLTFERDRFQRESIEQSEHSFKLRSQLDKKIKETSQELSESLERSKSLFSSLDLKINQMFSSSSHLRKKATDEEEELFAKKSLSFSVSPKNSPLKNFNSSFYEEKNEDVNEIAKRIIEKISIFSKLSTSLLKETEENEINLRGQSSEYARKLLQKEEELSNLRNQLEDLNGLNENLSRDNNKLKNQISEIQNRNVDNESIERRIQNERKKLENDLRNSSQKTSELLLKYQEKDVENVNLKEKVAKLERRMNEIKVEHIDKISELESKFSNETENMIDKAMFDTNEKLNQLKEAKKMISEQNKQLLMEKKSLEEKVERMERRPQSASSSEEENNRSKSGGIYNKEWMAQLSVAKERIARLSENNRILILELEEKRQVQQDIAKKYQQLSRENKELRIEISRIKQESIHRIRERYNVDLSHEVLRQVEGTQLMMKETDQQLEREKEKYTKWMERR